MIQCPCGSANAYVQCCQALHAGAKAQTPEALMRSRYSAFVLNNSSYLLQSWHVSTRPASLELDSTIQWFGLEVHSSSASGDKGRVHFTALSKDAGDWIRLTEQSNFQQDADGFWRYVDGDAQFDVLKPGRNDECPCGSGRKYKKCCAD